MLRRVKVEGDFFHPRIPDGAIYVGRGTPNLPASPYANPYTVKKYGLPEALRLFRAHLDEHPELVAQARQDLTGSAFACWCKPDEDCHADIWIEYVARPEPA